VVHSHFASRNTIFRCSSLWFFRRSSLVFSTFVASVKMPWLRPFGPCMSCTHRYQSLRRLPLDRRYTLRQPLVGWRRCAKNTHDPKGLFDTRSGSPRGPASIAAVHVKQAQVHLPTLPLSATKASLANLLLHHHRSGATQSISNVPEIQKITKKVARTESGTVAMKI